MILARGHLLSLCACLLIACGGSVSGQPGSGDSVTQLDVASADARGTESVSGTTIPSATRIIDAQGVRWTVRSGLSYQNGVADSGSNIAKLLYFDRHVYAFNNSGEWWQWSSGWYWADANPIVESANGASIPGVNQLVDANGVVWAVRNGLSYQNGVADGGSNIAQLFYVNGSIYVLNNSGEWWAWSDGWYQIDGDPRDGGVVTPPTDPTPTPTPTPDPTPTPTPVAGAHLLGGCGNCDGVAALQGLESFINRPVDYVLVWGWAQTAGDLMYAFHYLEDMWPTTYTLHYDVPMILSGGTFAQVYNGSLDDVYRDVAQTIASRDPHGVIRIGHEMNGTWYDWSQDSAAGTSAEFVLAFQRLVTIFRSVSPDFTFVWNPGAGKWAGIDFLPTYPGDAYVDFISFDMYEDAGFAQYSATDRWNHFLDNDGRGLDWLADFAAQHGKLIAFDEWASAIDDGVYITNMYNWMSTHNVGYQMYWHSDAAFPGGFSDHPVNAATFKSLFGR